MRSRLASGTGSGSGSRGTFVRFPLTSRNVAICLHFAPRQPGSTSRSSCRVLVRASLWPSNWATGCTAQGLAGGDRGEQSTCHYYCYHQHCASCVLVVFVPVEREGEEGKRGRDSKSCGIMLGQALMLLWLHVSARKACLPNEFAS